MLERIEEFKEQYRAGTRKLVPSSEVVAELRAASARRGYNTVSYALGDISRRVVRMDTSRHMPRDDKK